MRYELLIGLRYLRAQRKHEFISLITVITALGLTIGVMTLNVVLAVFTGFEEDLRDRILAFNAHVVVGTFNGSILDYRTVVQRLEQVTGVEAAAPFVYGQVMLTAKQNVAGVVVRAVGPESERIINVQRLLLQGTIEALAGPRDTGAALATMPTVIVGKGVAEKLGVGVGDVVNALSPVARPSSIGMAPRLTRFAVAGIFDSGMSEYDGTLIYMDLAVAQQLFDLGDVATGIEVRVRDPLAAKGVATRLAQTLGFPFRVRDWMELNHNLFAALRVGKTVYFIVLLLIVLVAVFNIVSMLIMVVLEKRKDVAILKSMGATRTSVGRIFVYKGMLIGVVGTALGNLGAYLVCELLKHYHFIKLSKDVYAIDTVQVRLYPEYFLAVTAAALALCWLATLYPARQAARLSPVDVIRYE